MFCAFVIYPAAFYMLSVAVETFLHDGVNFSEFVFVAGVPAFCVLGVPAILSHLPLLLSSLGVPLVFEGQHEVFGG